MPFMMSSYFFLSESFFIIFIIKRLSCMSLYIIPFPYTSHQMCYVQLLPTYLLIPCIYCVIMMLRTEARQKRDEEDDIIFINIVVPSLLMKKVVKDSVNLIYAVIFDTNKLKLCLLIKSDSR